MKNIEEITKTELFKTVDVLLDICLEWDNDNSERLIQRCYANGISTYTLAKFFHKSTVAEAIYKYINNDENFTEDEDIEDEDETPPEIAAISEKEKADEIFDNADTLPEKSKLIENNITKNSEYVWVVFSNFFNDYFDKNEKCTQYVGIFNSYETALKYIKEYCYVDDTLKNGALCNEHSVYDIKQIKIKTGKDIK